MKKCLAVLISIALMFVVLPINTLNASALTEGYYTYKVINGEATITGCDKSISGNITIPSTLDGYPVTRIDNRAFHSCSSLTNITIPGSITWMSEDVFAFCYNLTTVIIHDGFKVISPGAFWECSSLTSITIPYSVTDISIAAFEGCSSLKTVYYCGTEEQWNNVSGKEYNNQNLTSATIYYHNFGDWQTRTEPTVCKDGEQFRVCSICGLEEVVLIEAEQEHSFKMGVCTACHVISEEKLTYDVWDGEATITGKVGTITGDVVIPSTLGGYQVTSIGYDSFSQCFNLSSVTIPDTVKYIDAYAFSGCTSLISVTIPNSVKTIYGWAFSDCISLKSVAIPDSVDLIDIYAFGGCSSLNSITLPDGDISIWAQVFYDTAYYNNSSNWEEGVLYIDKHLIEAKASVSGSYAIKNGTVSIATSAFSSCKSLTYIEIPNSVLGISTSAFSGCSSLSSIDLPNGVKRIDEDAFSGCSSLTSFSIPASVTSIGVPAFVGCSSLANITVDSNNSNYSSLNGVLFNKDKTNIVRYPEGKVADSYIIPDVVTSIYPYAFYFCENINSIMIPNSVTSISFSAFSGCDSLNTIYYCGTEEQWNNISISDRTYLNKKTKYYHKYDNDSDTDCNICGFVRSITHTYDNACDTSCNICGATRTIEHTYDNDCDHECNICGNIRTVNPHEYTNACDTDCNICGFVRSIEHTYDNACDTECNVCRNIRIVNPHVYTNTCDTSCNICNAIRTIEHTYDNACDKNCNICGNIRTIVHTYDNACDSECNICGNIRTVNPHEYTNTCDTTCNICGFIRSITHTNPKEWTIRTESTCSQKGEKYGACSVCGEEVTAEIEINTNNHNYINGRCEWCNSYIESKHDYDAEFDETWVVEKENTASITITFSKDTYVEENWDYIYIYDANNNLVGEYTGAALASESIKVNGNIVKIRLVTDRVQNYYGFKVTNIEFACAHNYSIETKTVSCTEDGYKKHTCCYCGNIYYTDQVKALGHKYSSIVTTPICIEGGWTTHTCENCGNTYTDNYIPATGIHIYENGNCTQCKGLLESDHNYENLTDKTWEIYRKGATSITLIFSAETIVEEKYDHIYIYDAANNEIGKYTGNELASRSVTALGDTIKIRLCTDRVGTAYGFKLTDISAEYISGDLNGDSEVDIRDLIRLKKILLGNAQSESASSDVDSSGETTANDLTFLRKLIIGILAKEVY